MFEYTIQQYQCSHFPILQNFQEELLQRISRKLDVLRAEERALKEEISLNEELGRHVSTMVS